MNVCRICFKIIRNFRISIFLTLSTFLILAFVIVQSIHTKNDKNPVLLINEDNNTVLTRALESYMGNYVTFVKNEIFDATELDTALFNGKVVCIVRIPSNFTSDFMEDKPVTILSNMLVNTPDSQYVNALIGELQVLLDYCKKNEMSLKETVQYLKLKSKDGDYITELEQRNHKKEQFALYVNYMLYALISTIVIYTVNILVYFKQDGIEKHRKIAPVNADNVYRKIIAICILIAFGLTLFLVLCGAWITSMSIFSKHFFEILANAFTGAVFGVSLASLIGMLVDEIKRFDVWGNIVALGLCFTSGVFVSQDILSHKISMVTQYLPTYYYVKINNEWVNTDYAIPQHFRNFVLNEGIILCYSFILILIALIIGEKKVKRDLWP